nr:MAG TPA: hypothetical protein [Caudoviricetes sp.]
MEKKQMAKGKQTYKNHNIEDMLNLNSKWNEYISINKLSESIGTHDFLVKMGLRYHALRINVTGDDGMIALTLYENESFEASEMIATVVLNGIERYECSLKYPCITLDFLKHMKELSEAQNLLLKYQVI